MKLNSYLSILTAFSAVSAFSPFPPFSPFPELPKDNCKPSQLWKCQIEYNQCYMKNIFNVKKCMDEFEKCKEKECKSENTINSFEPTKDNVKILGRANYQDGYLWFGMTDAGVEYQFDGKTTVINVTADTKAYSEESPAYVGIYADGEVYNKTLITEKNTNFTVNFEEKGKHTVAFVKLSEAEQGSLRINEITADAKKIKPTAEKKKKIEFIGDSITCAFGVDGGEEDHYHTSIQDGTKSYAYLTAKKFDADVNIVAHSGFAILSAVSFTGERTPDSTLPPIYDKLGVTFGSEFFVLGNNEFDDGTYELQSTVWDDYGKYVPDIIVINLGTNDAFYFTTIDPSKVESEQEVFVQNYEDFLAQLRELYPKTEILCTLGMMGQEVYPLVEQAVNNYTTRTGDNSVKLFEFNVQNVEKNGMGVDTHPNAKSQLDAAHELIGEIEKVFKWKSDKKVNIDKLI